MSETARDVIAEPDTRVLVSAVSGLEIATKHRLGKLWTGKYDPAGLEYGAHVIW